MEVGANPGKILFFFSCFFFFNFFSKLVFYVSCKCKDLFFFFPSCSMLYLLSPRLCFFIVFNLDLFVNREDSLMS